MQSFVQNFFTTAKLSELKKKLLITNKIRKLRFENDEMTQNDLASRVGVARQTIVAVENAKYFPTLELAFKIAEVFDVNIEAVFTYEP